LSKALITGFNKVMLVGITAGYNVSILSLIRNFDGNKDSQLSEKEFSNMMNGAFNLLLKGKK
jgi:hypothetical protein